MRKLAVIENKTVTNIIVAPDLKSEAEITDALQKRQGEMMRQKNEDGTPYFTASGIADALTLYEAELRRDDFADHIDAGAGKIGDTFDPATGTFSTPPAPVVYADLTRKQFEFLLALTGFGTVWDALAAAAKAGGDLVTYAALTAERAGNTFRHDVTLATVATFRTQAAEIAPDVDLSDEAISAAWKQAEVFKGVGA